ncbi:MAG: OmpH family outer membrane protein [Planctomyces sp.]|nr:OmpH family outer membrane protein [Planctomyces sp.]
MKKLIVCSAAFALAAGVFLSQRDVLGQAASGAKPASPHQVGLIDMAYVFKNYDKFKASTEQLQADIKAADDQAKAMVEGMKQLQERLGSLQKGSPDHKKAEEAIITAQTKLETFRKTSQLDFLRREADVYKTVYLEVQKTVEQYARAYNYTLIMRFNRAPVEDADNPQEIIQSMNRQVVFYRGEDDLTDPILKYLNEKFTTGGTRAAQPRTANGGNQPRN